jgi:hypothetical protein
MSSCPRLATCPLFFELARKPALKVWKAYWCEGAFAGCERWRRFEAGEEAPLNLLPNGRLLDVPLEEVDAEHMA